LIYWIAGVGLILIGGGIFVAGASNFSRAATPVPGNRPVHALVTSGIHGWSRNPIYVGMSLVYGGIAIAARSPWAFVLALPLAIVMRYFVVAREEAYLERC
jgi:protein-S-isoprenylcysteine O-methyltransferase Ste14